MAPDTARASLERDLHDGAQQGLLALAYRLRQAADAADDTDARDRLEAAVREAEALLGELRDLAHGIFPAILGDRGLRAAAHSLRDAAAVPLEVEGLPADRLPDAVERAGYAIIASAVDAALSTGAAATRRHRSPGAGAAHGRGRERDIRIDRRG